MTRIRIIVALLAFVACAAPAMAKTFVFCSEGDPETLDPQTVSTVTGENAVEAMFDGLVRLSGENGTVAPGLAQSWTISPDGTTYTFQLRHGVRFHTTPTFKPTRDLNADDVLFSFGRQWHDDDPYHSTAGHPFSYFDDMEIAQLLVSIEKLDDYTIRFKLRHAEAPFLADLAMPFAMVLSAEYAAQLLKAGTPGLLETEPVGTGPFFMESYRKDVTIRFKAFDPYWGGRPPIDTLVFSITPNASVRLTKLRAGECQMMSFPDPADVDKIEHDPQLALVRREGLNVGYIALNASRPPFNDPRVRRAVNMAIDKTTIVRSVYGPGGTVAKNPLPPDLWSYNDDVVPYPYDPDAAQRLMIEAGLEKGLDVDLWYMPVTRAYNPDSKRIGEMVSDDLAQIGIRARLVTTAWSDYRDKVLAGVPTMAFYGWTTDNGDPDNILGILLGCRGNEPFTNNIAKWCNPAYNALITKAKLTADRSVREPLYRQAQQIFHDQAPWVPIAHGVVLSAIRKNVKGFKLDPFGRYLFDTIDLADE